MKKHIYVDIHAIHTVPPCNLNRGQDGAPKTVMYGGVRRLRVSSQCWKHAIRKYFTEKLEMENGIRTKKYAELVEKRIMEIDPEINEKKAAKVANQFFTKLMKKKAEDLEKEEKENINVLLFLTNNEINQIASFCLDSMKTKKEIAEIAKAELIKQIQGVPSVDMALFGRMVAIAPDCNVDACCQVAYAISTHEIDTEMDDFTAIDDMQGEDEAGETHLDTVEFASATLYRYATIDVTSLMELIDERAFDAVKAFLDAFICSMPEGKKNSFAPNTRPIMVYTAIRTDAPVSLADAFCKPVREKEYDAETKTEVFGYEDGSILRLKQKDNWFSKNYSEPAARFSNDPDLSNNDLSINEIPDAVSNEIKKIFQN